MYEDEWLWLKMLTLLVLVVFCLGVYSWVSYKVIHYVKTHEIVKKEVSDDK